MVVVAVVVVAVVVVAVVVVRYSAVVCSTTRWLATTNELVHRTDRKKINRVIVVQLIFDKNYKN